MLTISQIRERLADRRLQAVADATGVHYNTLRAIVRGDNTNPTHRVIEALSEYLERRP